jgi:thiol-disulfide isomerase/thioredoxin
MSIFKRVVFTLAVTVLAAAAGSAGVLMWRAFNPPPVAIGLNPVSPPTSTRATPVPPKLAVGDRRPDFSLADTNGVIRSIAEWDGKLLFINFWATWCPPCLEEIPTFVRLQGEYAAHGVQFLGIALDSEENVRNFLIEYAVNYPSLYGQREAIELSKRYGNSLGALPYTVVVSRDAKVIATHHGVLDEAAARALIENNR